MSTEPDTRPFTSAELAHFLEQLEVDRPPSRCSVIEARPLRVGASDPATTLGMGELVPFAAAGLHCVSGAAELASWAPPIPARTVRRPLAPSTPTPFLPAEPARGLRAVRLRLGFVLGALLLSGLVACLISTPSRARLAHAAHHGPPPLPTPPLGTRDPSPQAASAAFSQPSAHATSSRALLATSVAPAVPRDAAPSLDAASAAEDDAAREERANARAAHIDAPERVSEDAQRDPDGRSGARREAVDLLLAGRTRAALVAYRALPRSLRADPALVQLLRQLERELRECREHAESSCGS